MLEFETKQGYEISELICLKCLNRAIHVYGEDTLLKDIKCKCGEVGYLIKTGQTIKEPILCETCKAYNGKCKMGLHYDGCDCEYYEKVIH